MKKNKSSKIINYLAILSLILVLIFLFLPPQKSSHKIGFWVHKNIKESEKDSILAFVEQQINYDLCFIFSFSNNDLSDYDILWLHQSDTTILATLSATDLSALQKFIKKGGKLLITQEAVGYFEDLTDQKDLLSSKMVEAMDHGYGRNRGIHAFKQHPVFTGLYGGAYIFKPKMDTSVRITGFFGEVPQNTKIIAVDWAYIRLHEQDRLVFEQDLGKGKILGIGAYMDWNIPNYNQSVLEHFLRNVLLYLSGDIKSKEYYWNQQFSQNGLRIQTTEKIELPKTSAWPLKKWEDPGFYTSKDDFWDVPGERLLLMGQNHQGIEEIWSHPFMLLRDYQIQIRKKGEEAFKPLSDYTFSAQMPYNAVIRRYKIGNSFLKEIITNAVENPIAAIQYVVEGEDEFELALQFKTNLRLMWPYSEKVTGDVSISWNAPLNAFVFQDASSEMCGFVGATSIPEATLEGDFDHFNFTEGNWIGQPTEEILAGALATFKINSEKPLDVIISGGTDGLENLKKIYISGLQSPKQIYQKSVKHYEQILDNYMQFESPDFMFNTYYQQAIIGSEQFFVNTPGVGKSLVAGYATTAKGWNGEQKVNGRPGYAWYFGRDAQWSGFALNDIGDFEKVKDILQIFIDYQAADGKIFHELTTSGVVHYDAADATPLFVVLAGHYLRHSGDIDFIQKNWSAIKKAMDFCFSTDRNHDHLIDNAMVGHGWVEGGHLFGGRSTLYLSACWAAALEEGSQMADALKKEELAESWKYESEVVIDLINNKFWNPENQNFYHSIKDDGFIEDVTVMPAIPLYFQQVEESKQDKVFETLASDEFSADWGVRIAGKSNPYFNPNGYHTGSVWPLYTGWTSLAEYKNGRPLQGFSHLMSNMEIMCDWATGKVEEVLNGSVYEPSGVCAHQCWSQTMSLMPVVEGMLGFKPNAIKNQMELAPAIPVKWNGIHVKNLKMGAHKLTYSSHRKKGLIKFNFKSDTSLSLQVDFKPYLPAGTEIFSVKINDAETDFSTQKVNDLVQLILPFKLQSEAKIEVECKNGVGIIQEWHPLKPGDVSHGIRIINTSFENNIYQIELEGPSLSTKELRIYPGPYKFIDIKGASIKASGKDLEILNVSFGKGEGYVRKIVQINVR